MTTGRRTKVLAIAKDPATDPGTRAIADRWLEDHPEPIRQRRVPGVEPSEEYLRWQKSMRPKR